MERSEGDPVRSTEPRTVVPRLDGERGPADGGARPVRPPKAWAWYTILAAGLAAGVVAWAMGEWAYTAFAPVYKLTPDQRKDPAAQRASIAQQRQDAGVHVAMFTCGSLTATLGLTMGLVGGLARRSPSRGGMAALAGLSFGAVAGAAAAWAILPPYFRTFQASTDNLSHDLMIPLLVHAAMWICVGVIGGAALGSGLGDRALAIRGAFGGALGALVGTVVHEFLGALLFPLAETTKPIAEASGARLLTLMSVAVMASLGARWAVSPPSSAPDTPLGIR